MMKIQEQALAHNATVIAIGSGSCDQANRFATQFKFSGEIYLDEKLLAFKAFDLERGFFKTLGPSSLAKGIGALRHGFRQGWHAGDLWQQGGVFVIGPGEQILYAHRDRFAGDHADMNEALGMCPLSK